MNRLVRPRNFLAVIAWTTLLLNVFGCRYISLGGNYHLREAEEFTRQERYDEAIAEYKKHIDDRLAAPKRPEWENPYFYYLLIGDIEIGRGRPTEALASYKEAARNQIHSSLISDRYRYVARWYEEQGRYYEALEILKENRELDPLLFEAMLDRISKQIIKADDGSTLPEKTPISSANP